MSLLRISWLGRSSLVLSLPSWGHILVSAACLMEVTLVGWLLNHLNSLTVGSFCSLTFQHLLQGKMLSRESMNTC